MPNQLQAGTRPPGAPASGTTLSAMLLMPLPNHPLALLLLILLALGCISYSAMRFVANSALLAVRLNVSHFLIGMVVIGFGTSVPELCVSLLAALQHSDGIALGNAYGSNITNIGLGVGIAALIAVLRFMPAKVRFDAWFMLLTGLLSLLLLQDLHIDRLDGLLLLAVMAVQLGLAFYRHRCSRSNDPDIAGEISNIVGSSRPTVGLGKLLAFILLWLLALVLSSQYMVATATELARRIGISEVVIGLTLVALGTSLPEIASVAAASLQRNSEAVLGNIIGSCIFNALLVVGLAGLVAPLLADPQLLHRDLPWMLGFSLALVLLCALRWGRIPRWVGCLLVLGYAGYLGVIVVDVVWV